MTEMNSDVHSNQTRLEVETSNDNGKKYNVRAVLETPKTFGGILELRSTSNLSLRLHCHAPDTHSKPENKLTLLENEDDQMQEIQEEIEATEVMEVMETTKKYSRQQDRIVNNIQSLYSHIFGRD